MGAPARPISHADVKWVTFTVDNAIMGGVALQFGQTVRRICGVGRSVPDRDYWVLVGHLVAIASADPEWGGVAPGFDRVAVGPVGLVPVVSAGEMRSAVTVWAVRCSMRVWDWW